MVGMLFVTACGDDPASPAAPDQLSFTLQPSRSEPGTPIRPPPTVSIQNADGRTVSNATTRVAVRMGTNPSGTTLTGTTVVYAVDGVATFDDLGLDHVASGYTLIATAAGMDEATSAAFGIGFDISSMSAGGVHTCASSTGGSVYCWGANGAGMLGDGSEAPHETAMRAATPDGVTFVSVFAGANHTCAVTSTGRTYCWGQNRGGQLGDGTTTDRPTPVPVELPQINVTSMALGIAHTCALTTEGAVYCWGENVYGAIGDGTLAIRAMPTAVDPPGGARFKTLAVGFRHTCAITTSGSVYCWGSNGLGEVGDGTDERYRPEPTPVAADPSLRFVSVAGGTLHTCAVTERGAAYCWGASNSVGALGDGSGLWPQLIPVRVALPDGVDVTSVTAGSQHTCAVTQEGAAYCWGLNDTGQLGDGSSAMVRMTPVAVAASPTEPFASVTALFMHTCGLTRDNEAYCWGDNEFGRLGDGTTTQRRAPVRVLH
jgi:alpha-tubulin suppressor-like RCC1 family protein